MVVIILGVLFSPCLGYLLYIAIGALLWIWLSRKKMWKRTKELWRKRKVRQGAARVTEKIPEPV